MIGSFRLLFLLVPCWLMVVVSGFAQEAAAGAEEVVAEDPVVAPLSEARVFFHSGDYEKALEVLKDEVEEDHGTDRRLVALRARVLMATGDYEEAIALIEQDWAFEMTQEAQMLLYDIKRAQGDFEAAAEHAQVVMRSRRFAVPMDLLAIGRAALIHRGEPKDILNRFYKQVQQREPENAEVFQYIGDLALEKHDYQLAAENYDKGLQVEPTNTDLRCSLARTFFESDRKHALEILEKVLEQNPKNVEALLLMAEHHLLAELEDKSQALAFLERVEAVNAADPRPKAMRVVMALIEADEEAAAEWRTKAMAGRRMDPTIDYHIGEWMSSMMRFQEAVPYLRASLEIDSEFLPAKVALGQNLLRTGEEDEAWVILEGVSDRDQYNVAVYNLLALHDEIEDYEIINRKNFIVRMEASEAALFGDRVLDLLEQAEEDLHAKYDFKPSKPILIEFFPNQEDFAVRTFGFMGGDGFLGACFGLVVTMNSPNNGATGKTNWESTLWHEYCHAVTLGATKNRMPRWLTEGISVYEERRRDATCGEQLDIDARYMILEGEELIPLSQLNYGFLRPKSGQHMMFAYLQSSLFIDYFMETFGEEKMRLIIRDLRDGKKFSEACERHAEPLAALEEAFFAYAKERARQYGGKLEWIRPEENLAALSLAELEDWVARNPHNYYGLRTHAAALLKEERFEDAKAVLERLVERFPDHADAGSPYQMLAALYRQTDDREREREMLWELTSRSTDWLDEMLQLLEYELEAEGWDRVARLTEQIVAINPYIARAHQARAIRHRALEEADEAIASYETLLTLSPKNPAQIHFAVADLLKETDRFKAKRHTLDALAEAPRYRDALRLLRKLQSPEPEVEVNAKEEASESEGL